MPTSAPAVSRIPLSTFAIAFGTAGLAGIWSVACRFLGFTGLIGDVLWIVTAIVWIWLIVSHAIRGSRSSATLASQLRDPVQGPIAALVPAIGMLLGAELYGLWPVGGVILVLVSMLASAAFAGWILTYWMRGGINLDAVHGGWLLPTVAGGYVASVAAAEVGLHALAIADFAVGSFFWIVMFAIVFVRMILRPPLPAPLVPTLAILAAPPALGGRAWFDLVGLRVDDLGLAIAGLGVVAVLMQLGLIPLYRQLKFSLGFWSFTFPLAAVGRYAIAWLFITQPIGWQFGIIVILALVTLVILAVATLSLRQLVNARKKEPVAI